MTEIDTPDSLPSDRIPPVRNGTGSITGAIGLRRRHIAPHPDEQHVLPLDEIEDIPAGSHVSILISGAWTNAYLPEDGRMRGPLIWAQGTRRNGAAIERIETERAETGRALVATFIVLMAALLVLEATFIARSLDTGLPGLTPIGLLLPGSLGAMAAGIAFFLSGNWFFIVPVRSVLRRVRPIHLKPCTLDVPMHPVGRG